MITADGMVLDSDLRWLDAPIDQFARPAYPHDFGIQYTGFRLILRPSPLVSLLYDICKILTIMYDIVLCDNISLSLIKTSGWWEHSEKEIRKWNQSLIHWVVLDSDTVYIQSPEGPHLSTVREFEN